MDGAEHGGAEAEDDADGEYEEESDPQVPWQRRKK